MPQGLMLTESYHEVADFQSGIRALGAAVVAVDAEHFAASVSTLVLDDVAVEIVRARPMLLIGAAAERRSGCLLVLGGGRDMRWNGQSVDAHDVAVLTPGSCLSAAFQAPWAGAFVSADARGSGGGVLPFRDGAASGRHGAVRIQRSDAQAHARLATLLREA